MDYRPRSMPQRSVDLEQEESPAAPGGAAPGNRELLAATGLDVNLGRAWHDDALAIASWLDEDV
jgi:hypothetical protein